MLLIAVPMAFHLSFAVHYCGGQVASVRMFGHTVGMCCCGDEGDGHANHLHGIVGYLPDEGNTCCSDEFVTVETDDYQAPAFTTLSHPDIGMAPFVFLPAQLLQLNKRFATRKHQIIFPPGGYSGYGTDLLTQICIFRI